MSIGYKKEGFDTHINVSTGGTTAFGIVPISVNLSTGFGSISVNKQNPVYLARMEVFLGDLANNSGRSLGFYIKDTKIGESSFWRSGNTIFYTRLSISGQSSFSWSSTLMQSIYFFYLKYNDDYYIFDSDTENFPTIYENNMGNYKKTSAELETVVGFPYGDGESTSQGGQGEMTDTSDPIEIDSKPLLTSGEFLRVYKTNATGLTALKEKLISNGFLDGLIPKLRTDATDYLLGLNAIPLASTDVASDTIKIANLDTEVSAEYLTWYIADLDCGEIDIKEYFQTFMDYSPYTKLSIYLPYCATIPLNIDMFQNDKIKLKYRIDFLTGYCLAIISNSEGVVTTATGNCAYNLPIRSNDYNNIVSRGLAVVGGIVGTAGALATGNVPLAVGTAGATLAGGLSLGNAMEKPNVYSNGSLGGNYGLLGNKTPYLIIQRPTISVPKDYGKTIGYMSRITAKLGELTGYTVVEEIHLEHISATDDEKRLIENALKSGVIL